MSSFFTSTPTAQQFHQAASQLLGSPSSSGGGMSGSTSPSGVNASPVTSCCEGGRPIVTDPLTGQSVCSCQYDPGRLALSSYPRLSAYGANPYSPPNDQNPYPSLESSAFYSPLGGAYAGLKEGSGPGDMTCWPNSGSLQSGYYSYDPTFAAAYGYGGGYDLAARRKNATRESTATLKAWLNEHKKNPYPTKGEKIMLAIITKMTLTQVSTWFANARRRLKKENKMTWEPKNKTDDDDEDIRDDDDDCDSTHGGSSGSPALSVTNNNTILGLVKSDSSASDLKGGGMNGSSGGLLGGPGGVSGASNLNKPKIWSLADTAACKTPPPSHHPHHLIPGGGGAGHNPGTGSTNTTSPNNLNHHHLNALNHHAIAAAAHHHIHGPQPPVTSSWSFTLPGYRPYGSFLSPTTAGGMSHSGGLGPSSENGIGTDTPPQTPPNLKVPLLPGSLSHFGPHHGGSHMNNAIVPSHHHPHHHAHPHLQQHHHSNGLSSAADLSGLPNSTAFKPVLKSSSGGGFCV